MKLIIGLGNPGEKYKKTRHNVGFLALDFLRDQWNGGEWKSEKKWDVSLSEISSFSTEKILLIQPQSYMNLSGQPVRAVMDFYKIKEEDILIIFDDIDLPLGTVRYRETGASGGHNGIKSLISHLGTTSFSRIKIGISTPLREQIDASDFVLMNFPKEEWKNLTTLFPEIQKQVEEFLRK